MIKLSRTGITTLKRQYRAVLLKCLLINAGILFAANGAMAAGDLTVMDNAITEYPANGTYKLLTSDELNTLNGKQDVIDAEHKLSSTLVSFTEAEAAALASGIDTTKVAQIATNTAAIADINTLVGAAETSAISGGILNGVTIDGGTPETTVIGALKTVASNAAGKALDNEFSGNNTFKGNVVLGDAAADTVTINGTTTFNGTTSFAQQITATNGIKVGEAGALSSTSDHNLNMGANTLSNVKAIVLEDSGKTASLTLDTNALHVNKGITSDAAVTSNSLKVGANAEFMVNPAGNVVTSGTLKSGAATVASLKIDGTAFGITDTGAATVNSVQIGTTAYKIESTGNAKLAAVTVDSLNAGEGEIKTTGAINGGTVSAKTGLSVGTDGSMLKVNATDGTVIGGNATVAGNLKVGSANAISGTGTNLNINGNDLSNVKNITTTGTVNVNGATLTGSSTQLAVDKKFVVTDGGADITGDVEVDGAVTASDGFSIKDADDKEQFSATGNGLKIGTDVSGAAGTKFSVNAADGNTTIAGTVTADGESKFAKDGEGAYSLDVTADAVTANKVVAAKAGVKFGDDDTAMTSASHSGAVAADASEQGQVIASVQSVADTRVAINTDARTVLGGIYKVSTEAGAAVTYDNTALTGATDTEPNLGHGFADDQANLAAALKNYAANVAAATGLSYDETGANVTEYADRADDADYSEIADNTSLRAAIEKLDSNIGAGDKLGTITVRDASVAVNGLATTNTVNENLIALNETIGDLTSLSEDTGGSVGNAMARRDEEGAAISKPATVLEALNNIDATLGQIHGLKLGNSDLQEKSNLADGTTVEQHLVSLDNAIGNRVDGFATDMDVDYTADALNDKADLVTSISQVASNIGAAPTTTLNGVDAGNTVNANIDTINTNLGDVQTAIRNSHYGQGANDMSEMVSKVDNKLYSLDRDVRKLKKEFKAGMASMAAMSALVPNARANGNTQLSIGTGGYDGHMAAAVGGFHWFNNNVMLNVGASYGDSSEVSYRAGLTFTW